MAEKKEKAEDQEKKQTRYFLFAIIIVLLFIISLLSVKYLFPEKQEVQSYSYNGFVFSNITGLWFTEIQKAGTNKVYKVPLHYGPKQIQDIPVPPEVNSYKNKSALYITFDPEEKNLSFVALAASELSINLAQTLNITPLSSCTVNKTAACSNRTIVNCQNPGYPAVYLRHANKTKIYTENNCIIVEGQEEELVKASDRLLLKWFSVMP